MPPGVLNSPYLLTPELAYGWAKVEITMRILGHSVRLTETLRTNERQNELYEQGRTTAGPRVTNAKAGESSHNPNPQGQSKALDCCFDGPHPYSETHPWDLLRNPVTA